MKATALLERQHRKVEALFESLEGASANEKIVQELATALTAHAAIEEEIFYPACRRFKKDMILESREEHELMAFALRRVIASDPQGETFQAKVKACKETVLHHVREEEQELFPVAARSLGEEEDESLGEQMEARFKELTQSGYDAIVAAKKARRTADGQRSRAEGKAETSTTPKTTSRKKTGHAARKAA